jgi:hypothetical protein
MIAKIEAGGTVHVSEKRRHGHVSLDLWQRIVRALENEGVELLEQTNGQGGGGRWSEPR